MPIPDYIVRLRRAVAHDLLFLTGVTGVVIDDSHRILLHRRADDGQWSTPGGILEPGEQPADALAREVEEETGVRVVPEWICSVQTEAPMTYPNGDCAQYLDIAFRCRPVGGEARINDDESLDVGWFELDALPELPEKIRRRIGWGLRDERAAWFHGTMEPDLRGLHLGLAK